jgi:hypothetical protein
MLRLPTDEGTLDTSAVSAMATATPCSVNHNLAAFQSPVTVVH